MPALDARAESPEGHTFRSRQNKMSNEVIFQIRNIFAVVMTCRCQKASHYKEWPFEQVQFLRVSTSTGASGSQMDAQCDFA